MCVLLLYDLLQTKFSAETFNVFYVRYALNGKSQRNILASNPNETTVSMMQEAFCGSLTK